MKRLLLFLLAAVFGCIALVASLRVWPYHYVATPKSTIRILDGAGRPIPGVHINRTWKTFEHQYPPDEGEDRAITDADGVVRFPRQVAQVPMLHRIERALTGMIPMMCGPGGDVCGYSEFWMDWPRGYTLRLDEREWQKDANTYKNRERIHLHPPAANPESPTGMQAGLFFSKRSRDLDLTFVASAEPK